MNPHVLLAVLEDVRELDYKVEETLALVESKIHEEDLNLEEYTRASVLRDINLKQTLSNTVLSIKNFFYINWNKFYNKVSIVESTLKLDPANIYATMDDISRDRYRHIISDLSNNSNYSESEVARKVVETAAASNIDIQQHVGYHLIDHGFFNFAEKIGYKPTFKVFVINWLKKYPNLGYMGGIFLITVALSALSFFTAIIVSHNLLFTLLFSVGQLFIASNLATLIINKLLAYILPTALPPKIELKDFIPENCKTMIVIPSMLSGMEKVDKLVYELEKRFLCNKYKNLFYALLCDYKDSDVEESEGDYQLLAYAREKIRELNEKHMDEGFNVFYFFHRKRQFSQKEGVWMAWERKRGKLLQLVEWLTKEGNFFSVIDGDLDKLTDIKYVITLDEDTMLPADSALKLIGAMEHPLNRPVVNPDTRIVTRGYGFIQPRVILMPEAEGLSNFTHIFVTESGYDSYSNATSDIYQDLFNRSIFWGKGIFDVQAIKESLGDRFPENRILSHDLIESCFSKAAYLSDTSIIEDYPPTFNSYLMRDSRWIRGDWQLIPWLFPNIMSKGNTFEKNPLDFLSKWLIFTNLRRSMILPLFLFSYMLSWLVIKSDILTAYLSVLFFSQIFIELDDISRPISHKMPLTEKLILIVSSVKKKITLVGAYFVGLSLLALNKTQAILISLYRLLTNKHLLEWTTFDEAQQLVDKNASLRKQLLSPFTIANLLIILYLVQSGKATVINTAIIVLWLLSPAIYTHISRPLKTKKLREYITDKERMLSYAKKIWLFFESYTNEESNHLPPDNLQLIPTTKIAFRTSPTNIGFYLLSLLSAFDLGIVTADNFVDRLKKTLSTIVKLKKYEGQLYNWYDVKTLEPLNTYISTADAGNYVATLMLLESACDDLVKNSTSLSKENIEELIYVRKALKSLYLASDFTFLYNKNMEVFSIGFNSDTCEKDSSHYDFLASEARITSYVAIALDQVETKHWFNISRPYQVRKGKFYLMSWGGTMFEYLLPTLLFNEKDNTLLGQTAKEICSLQIKYGHDNGIPWGISESNFDSFDLDANYQYKMMGVPKLALKRYDTEDLVISPYSSFLALMVNPVAAEKNLKLLEKHKALGLYGFFEAIHFTRSKKDALEEQLVQIYTAHHQGMCMVAINNVLNDRLMVRRMHSNNYVKSCEILLDERIPEVANVVDPNQYGYDKRVSSVKIYEKDRVRFSSTPNTLFPIAQIFGNGRYSTMITNSGAGYSKFKDIYLNRFSEDLSLDNSGNHIYIKDVDLDYFWSATYQPTLKQAEKYEAKFDDEHAEFHRLDRNTNTSLTVLVPPEKNFELRILTLKNSSVFPKEYEITTYNEVMLDDFKAGVTHPAFNKLFIETSCIDEILIAKRRKRNQKDPDRYAFHFGYSETEDFTLDSYETCRSNFVGRTKTPRNPVMMHKVLTNTLGAVLDPIFSLRYKVKLLPGETKKIYFVYGYATNPHEIKATKDLIQANGSISELSYLNGHYVEARRTHLGITVGQEITFQRVASRLIYPDFRLQEQSDLQHYKGKNVLFRFGISGDNKILVLKVNSTNIEMLRNMVLLHKYLRILRFQIDLVFLIDETISYEETLERDVASLVGPEEKNSGIFILNVVNMSIEEKHTLLALAKAVFDTSLGSLDEQISIATRYSEPGVVKVPPTRRSNVIESIGTIKEELDDLEFYNGLGGFSDNGRKYSINYNPNYPTPLPWTNVISNETFGTVVSEAGLGYTWNINSQINKITPWSNDYVCDPQGEAIYLKDTLTGAVFGATPLPCNDSEFSVVHAPGYTDYIGRYGLVEHALRVFVDSNDPVKILKLTLTNKSNYDKKFEVTYYVDFVLGEYSCPDQENLNIQFNSDNQSITAMNPSNEVFKDKTAFMAASNVLVSATSDRKRFFGIGGSIESPLWVTESKRKIVGFKDVSDKCGVITIEMWVPRNSHASAAFILGQTDNPESCAPLIDTYTNLDNLDQKLQRVIDSWQILQNKIVIHTPDTKLNYLVNNWLLYQVVSSRLYGRTSFYQASGAFGFRDQLQDVMALVHSDTGKIRNHIILCCSHQFKEGDVQHWWHNPSNVGVRTRISDDLLWLPFVVSFYIEKTGDFSILSETAPYLDMSQVPQDSESLYGIPTISEEVGTVLDHCIRAIERSLQFGVHGLPLIGSGDWNDGLNSVGDEGKGESVWLGWFLIAVLENFSKLPGDFDKENYLKKAEELKENINNTGWDGEWFVRAFYDDGTPVGSHVNNECKIDSITQSWSIISKATSLDKMSRAMTSHNLYLEDSKHGLVNLLTPPFHDSEPFPGYIQGYPEGVRENGGHYTHGAVWALKAYALQKNADKVQELLNVLNPISRSLDKDKVNVYKSEPYVMVGDIYSNSQHMGRGGWSWYTGSAGWMYQVCIEDVLGLKKFAEYFTLEPVIPKSWKGFDMQYHHKGTNYNITVKRGSHKGLSQNGKVQEDKKIKLIENAGEVIVELVI